MGKIQNNIVTKGFSGKYSEDLMFRQIDKKTTFSRVGVNTKSPTAQQTEVRKKFTEASFFASGAIDNPQTFADYKTMAELQGLKSAYIAALTDFLTEPEIGGAFTAGYKGQVGELINIVPKVPYKITEIDVSILRPDGAVLESGKAQPSVENWKYAATVANAAVKGSKLVLVARDRQGREVTFEQVL
ncbi:hypothetical protein [Chryseosolibacter indicus]|uniref:Uncharacterized protein n=1 Tax=Chryseosolibacter indicus TaxID=2782351 RepID=A0ABS5W0C0_9BACT|nr:hypothetical protein [Chryseosolibacter indicus]MBT1706429.1 hypothetical protein [Chryseosolibacter indicus]